MSDEAAVLVVNVGSSSVKLRLLAIDDTLLDERDLSGPGDETAFRDALAAYRGVESVGHRVVHGGARFHGPVVVDDDVRAALADLVELAPLHQPPALRALDAARHALPDALHVACFDTAFHASLRPAASTYAVPLDWRTRLGVRRYGFHGLSHAYAARRAAELLGRELAALRTVICHLGAGASLCAVQGGRSVDTTMGFTPLEGLVMATRSGSVDPGLVLWLIRQAGLDPADVEDALERRSGLLGLCGSADMRVVLARAADHDVAAELALGVYCHHLRGSVAAMAASLGGIDALVFTGGAGEREPRLRRAALEGLAFLGVELDEAQNARATGELELDVSASAAACRTVVVRAREDVEIAGQVRAIIAGA